MEVTCPRPTAAPEPVFSWPWLPPPPPGLLDRRRPLAFPAADTELAFRAGRPWRLPPHTPVWAPHAPRGCPEPCSDLGGTGNNNVWVCLPGKQGLIQEP